MTFENMEIFSKKLSLITFIFTIVLFMLLDISKSFIDRKLEGADNNSIIRISEAYKKWKSIQNNARLEYQVSREWLPIYSQYINKVSPLCHP